MPRDIYTCVRIYRARDGYRSSVYVAPPCKRHDIVSVREDGNGLDIELCTSSKTIVDYVAKNYPSRVNGRHPYILARELASLINREIKEIMIIERPKINEKVCIITFYQGGKS